MKTRTIAAGGTNLISASERRRARLETTSDAELLEAIDRCRYQIERLRLEARWYRYELEDRRRDAYAEKAEIRKSLSASRTLEVLAAVNAGETIRSISSRMGLNPSTVAGYIARGKRAESE